MQLSGNKQDWSKYYGLFSILSNPSIFGGDINAKADKKKRFSLIRLSKYTIDGVLHFTYETPINVSKYPVVLQDNANIKVEFFKFNKEASSASEQNSAEEPDIESNNSFSAQVSIKELRQAADEIMTSLKSRKDQFFCELAQSILERLNIFDFITDSPEGEDFQVIFFNHKRNCEEFHKIRIRSNMSHLYLVGSNRASNFKYDIVNVKLSNPETSKINSFGDNETGSLERLSEIERLGGKLKYRTIEGKFFLSGLMLIDMQMPKILAEMIKNFYTGEKVTIKDLTEELNEINMFKVKSDLIEKSRIYEFKIRQFLYACACGMKPTKTWRGNGYNHGFFYIDKNGDMIFYDPTDKELMEKFLFNNTRLCIANEDKSKFGQIEKEDGQWLFKLNLEIRFT